MKRWLIHFLDYTVDCKILQHRWPWYCNWVSNLWSEYECPCKRCALSRAIDEMGSDAFDA